MSTTNTPRAIVETPDMGITLSDGCRLSARVWMPEDAPHGNLDTRTPWPSLLWGH